MAASAVSPPRRCLPSGSSKVSKPASMPLPALSGAALTKAPVA